MKTKLVVALIALGMLTGVLMAAAPARGIAQIALDPPKFHPVYYVPGEQMQFTISIAGGDPRTYDALVVWDDGVTLTNYSGNLFNDMTIPTPQTSITLNFNIPDVTDPNPMPDGDFYWVEVHDAGWIESGGAIGTTMDRWQFSIRTWTMSLETSRTRYLPGDTVTILWSVNLIRDGTLAPSGDGQLWVNDWPNGNALIAPNPYVFTGSSGQFSFQLLGTIPTNRQVLAQAWFNDTRSNAERFVFTTALASIDGLRMIVNVAAATYEPGGIVTVDISAKVTDFAPNPGNPGAAGVEVDIAVTDQSTGRVVPSYGALNLLTDSHGNLRHVFQLNTTIPDGTSFLVRADGVANNAVTSFATDTFVVNSRAGMTIVLSFDKSQYLSGDTVRMTVDVSGSAGPFTFIYEARDASPGGGLIERRTLTSNVYQYTIPTTFDGSILFSATVDDGQGNRRFGSQSFFVVLGILVVNLDRSEYSGLETITATYSLTRNPAVLTNPTYYYEIFDTSGILVRSGVATGSSVQYQVPQVPSNSYMFRITATEAGRALSGSSTAVIVSGVLLSIGFDRPSYNPGETMRISYTLTPRGRTALPSNFLFVIAMPGAPQKTVQTTASSGAITYTVPGGMNQGAQFVTVQEANTGAFAVESVTIGQTNPLWSDIGGIPAIVVVLGLFLALLFILMILMWRRTMGGMVPRAPGERPPMEKPAPPATAGPGPAPMTVTCKACSAPIEITTSKRPIEVMCPSCGETQMVQ